MAIDTDRILNLTPGQFESVILSGNRTIEAEYEVKGVNYVCLLGQSDDPIARFAKEVPEDTEYVINFNQDTSGVNKYDHYPYNASGLALIPKDRG